MRQSKRHMNHKNKNEINSLNIYDSSQSYKKYVFI